MNKINMHKTVPIWLGLFLTLIAIWLQITNIVFIQQFLRRLEELAYDIQLRSNLLTHHYHTNGSIVIVDVDDKSFALQGRWPWPRDKLATLVSNLKSAGAVVVVFDSIFSEPEDNIANKLLKISADQNYLTPEVKTFLDKIAPLVDNDKKFSASLAQIDSILGISFTNTNTIHGSVPAPLIRLQTPVEKNIPFIVEPGILGNFSELQSSAKSTGFINAFADDDGVIRRVPLLIRYKDGLYPSLALEAARLYLLANIKLVTANYGNKANLEGVSFDQFIIPTDAKSQVIIPFLGSAHTFPYISANDVIVNQFPTNKVEGKLVLVGSTATALGDLKPTAIESFYPGVEIQATIADGILSHRFSYKPAWSLGAELTLTLLLGVLLSISFPYLGPRLLSAFIFIIPITLMFINNYLWNRTGLIIAIFIPVSLSILLGAVNIIYAYLFESHRREHLKRIFEQYVSAKHIDEMLKFSGELGLLGEDREMTVLFADIRNFTHISESMKAAQVKELLNNILTPMTEIIFKHRGTIDKYVGDSIMAFWGAPLKDKKHAQHAIAATLEMQHAIKKLNHEFANQNLPHIVMGIGLNTGIMSVGDMGSKYRRNYTVLGDAVNLASRIEHLTKFYGVEIIVSEHTVHDQPLFVFRKLDRIRVVGKEISIEIYEPICSIAKLSAEKKREITLFHEALNYYFAQEWEKSRILFMQLQQQYSQVKLYQIYLQRIDEFEKNPPPANWDGVYTFTTK